MPKVYDSLVDTETRCRRYSIEEDIIAIKLKCYNKHYPCYKRHGELEKHAIKYWPEPSFNEKVISCDVYKHELTINGYMMVERCLSCQPWFNNRYKYHYHIYFEI